MRKPFLRSWSAAVLVLAAACGGGGTEPPAPPPPGEKPVATVTVTPPSSTLEPLQQLQLSALLRDSDGATLTGRTISWSSSHQERASVSTTGLVTAHSAGEVTITASSGGKAGIATVTVRSSEGIGPAGGSVVLAGGAVTITVPPGAVAAPTTFTASIRPQPASALPPSWQQVGSVYALGPAGATFAQPVTVTLRYNPGDLPAFAMTGDLSVLHLSSGQWSALTDVVINPAARTITGRTSSFSEFGVAAEDPVVVLAPTRSSVNPQRRSATLTVSLIARGQSLPLPAGTEPIRYRWRTTGDNGALDRNPTEWTTEDNALYTATNPALGQMSGQIDLVYVDVLLNPESLQPSSGIAPRIVTKQGIIDADLALTYELAPNRVTIGRGASTNVGLLIRNKQGQGLELPGNQKLAWDNTGTHGDIPNVFDGRQRSVTYTARMTFSVPPPRLDEVTAEVWEYRTVIGRKARTLVGLEVGYDEHSRLDSTRVYDLRSFIEVAVPYTVTLTPSATQVTTQGTVALEVGLTPANTGPGILYKFTNTGGWGSLSVPLNTPTEQAQVTYNAGPVGGGSDVITVQAVSVIQGVERAVLAEASVTIAVEGPASFTEIATASGGLHTCALTADGQAWCWGRNTRGQLGDGTQVRRTRPVKVNTGVRFSRIAAGTVHTCALTETGAAWCWGDHAFGQTGDGGPYGPQHPPRLTPVAVSGPPLVSLSAGFNTTCGLTAIGQVFCWGSNMHTQIGDGTPENRVTPVPVLGGVGRVSVGTFQACASSNPDGVTWCWGDNGKDADGYNADYSPQIWGPNLLGTGLTQRQIYQPAAVATPPLHGVSVGTGFMCGWVVTGEAHCSGLNSYGQLGDSTFQWRSSWAPVRGEQLFTTIAAGGAHACGINVTKQIWCWGRNNLGQLGDGTGTNRRTPVQVDLDGKQFVRLSSGSGTTCAITTEGEAYCWGGNTEGQLGDGTLASRSLPVLIEP